VAVTTVTRGCSLISFQYPRAVSTESRQISDVNSSSNAIEAVLPEMPEDLEHVPSVSRATYSRPLTKLHTLWASAHIAAAAARHSHQTPPLAMIGSRGLLRPVALPARRFHLLEEPACGAVRERRRSGSSYGLHALPIIRRLCIGRCPRSPPGAQRAVALAHPT